MHTVGRTNEMRLHNIIHLIRKHLFNITLVPMQTEHYIFDTLHSLNNNNNNNKILR